MAWLGKARHGVAWLGSAGRGLAKHSKARYFMIMARRGLAGLGWAGLGVARRGLAWQGSAGLGGA